MEALSVCILALIVLLLIHRAGRKNREPSVKILLEDADSKILMEPDKAEFYLSEPFLGEDKARRAEIFEQSVSLLQMNKEGPKLT